MSSVISKINQPTTALRAIAFAGLVGTTMLAGTFTTARAEPTTMHLAQATPMPAPTAPQNPAAAGATETKGESVEQRITNLHMALKITPAQEASWKGVAQAMRDNAASMEKLIAASRATPTQNMTALEDLAAYQKFAQAHVDGLKNLMSAFSTLYATMPAAQKKVADDVFNAPMPAIGRG